MEGLGPSWAIAPRTRLATNEELYSVAMVEKEKATETCRRSWRLPSYSAILAIVIFVPIAISNPDTFLFSSIFLVAPILLIFSLILIVLLIRAAFGHGRRLVLPILATLAIVWAIPVFSFFYNRAHPFELHENVRWLAWSHEYKREVLAQRASANGDLKYIEWDATGFAGVANNTVYLVFDPTDDLSGAAKSHQPGKFNGIPCKAFWVRRLENHWYAVLFYTDQTWNECD